MGFSRTTVYLIFAFLMLTCASQAQTGYIVKDFVSEKAVPFNLNEVRLLESPFKMPWRKMQPGCSL